MAEEKGTEVEGSAGSAIGWSHCVGSLIWSVLVFSLSTGIPI